MRVLGITTLVVAATAANVCDMTSTVNNNKYFYMAEPAAGQPRNGIDRHMDFGHCKMDSEGTTKTCVVDKCVGNMVATGKTTLLCYQDTKVVPAPGSNLKCSPDTSKSWGIVPNKKIFDPFNIYFRFYYGSPSCAKAAMVKDVNTAMWPGPNNSKLTTVQFSTAILGTIRGFPSPHPKLDPAAWMTGGALDYKKAVAVPGKKEYVRGEYEATFQMQKYWKNCKILDKNDKNNGGYYTPETGVCVPLGANVSMQFQAEWAYKGEPTICSKADIAWGPWWAELTVGDGKLSVGSLLFLVGPAVVSCLCVTTLLSLCLCFCCMCRKSS